MERFNVVLSAKIDQLLRLIEIVRAQNKANILIRLTPHMPYWGMPGGRRYVVW